MAVLVGKRVCPGSRRPPRLLPGWMNALTFGRDVAPLGRKVGRHGLCPWGSTRKEGRPVGEPKNAGMTEKKKRDAAAAVCWITLGCMISIWSASFPFGKSERPGPAIFPLGTGLILISLGLVLFFQVRKRDEEKNEEKHVPLIPHGAAFRRVAFSLGGMLLSAVLIDHLGFLLTFFCLILFLVRAVQPQEWEKDTFYAVIFTLAAYLLFQVLLKTTLPKGFLGF
jgi:hypothetical protein